MPGERFRLYAAFLPPYGCAPNTTPGDQFLATPDERRRAQGRSQPADPFDDPIG